MLSTKNLRPPPRPPPRCRGGGLRATHPRITPRAAPPDADPSCPVSAELARTLLLHPSLLPPPTAPSPLLPPSAVAAAVVAALWRPDTPVPGHGPRCAFLFTLPQDVGVGAPVDAASARRARSWHAKEAWLTCAEFLDHVAQDAPAASLATAAEVALVGPTSFGGRSGKTATQAVDCTPPDGGTPRRLSVIMTRCDEGGPWKGMYLVCGVRMGDYAQ